MAQYRQENCTAPIRVAFMVREWRGAHPHGGSGRWQVSHVGTSWAGRGITPHFSQRAGGAVVSSCSTRLILPIT